MGRLKLGIGISVVSGAMLASSGLAMAGGAVYSAPPSCTSQQLRDGPGANEALVFDDLKHKGNCWALTWVDTLNNNYWASWDATTGFPNDKIQSVKTGSGVRLTLFWNGLNTHDEGQPLLIPPSQSQQYENLNSWNKQASAARVVLTSQDQYCWSNPKSGQAGYSYLSFWDGSNFGGQDCIMLSLYGYSLSGYKDPVAMGYRNDNASSYWTSVKGASFYRDSNYGTLLLAAPNQTYSCGTLNNLVSCRINNGTNNIDNMISSVKW
jgi:hypothetical protein